MNAIALIQSESYPLPLIIILGAIILAFVSGYLARGGVEHWLSGHLGASEPSSSTLGTSEPRRPF